MSVINEKVKDVNSEDQLKCNDCNVIFNSLAQKEQHLQGKKHAAFVVLKKSKLPDKTPTPINKTHFCSVCNIALNSDGQVKQHVNGMRHKLAAGTVTQTPEWWVEQQELFSSTSTKRSSGNGIGETYRCDTCKLDLNSAFQYNSHMEGSKHKEKMEKQVKKKRAKTEFRYGRGSPAEHFIPPFGNRALYPGHFNGARPPMHSEPWSRCAFGPIGRYPCLRPWRQMGFRPYSLHTQGGVRGRSVR